MDTGNHALSTYLSGNQISVSGERIQAVYFIQAKDESHARSRAEDICLEETVELPAGVIDPGSDVEKYIVGRVESLGMIRERPGIWKSVITYSSETAGREFPQLLNLLFGNISIKPGIRLADLELPPSILKNLPGPRFGRDGLRKILGVDHRPLLCTALKPMGLSSQDLAALAYDFALGGIDIIKDDHGITGQDFAPFQERVQACSEAVARANAKTGGHSLYMPSVTAPAHLVLERARFARKAGAGGLLVTPGLLGFDTLRLLAEDPEVSLPLMAHPSFLGSFTAHPDSGIHHGLIYGLLPRLAGADAVVFPNSGGRFSFSPEETGHIVVESGKELPGIQKTFPVPAGGMTLDRVAEMLRFYGKESIFLMGGGLYSAGNDLPATCRSFLEAVQT